jgi:hypothetical protein
MTSLPTSNAPPIAIIAVVAPANKAANPIIEYEAAIMEIAIPDINVR